MRNAIKGGIDLSLLEHSNQMIEKIRQEKEDKLNSDYIKSLEKQRCEKCGCTGAHFCTGEPKDAKYFEIEQILKEEIPKGNYQIGVKL